MTDKTQSPPSAAEIEEMCQETTRVVAIAAENAQRLSNMPEARQREAIQEAFDESDVVIGLYPNDHQPEGIEALILKGEAWMHIPPDTYPGAYTTYLPFASREDAEEARQLLGDGAVTH